MNKKDQQNYVSIDSLHESPRRRRGRPKKSKKVSTPESSPTKTVPASAKPEALSEETIQKTIAFEPNPGPQTSFLSASEQEVLYGGSAGGGKSYAMIADPVRYFDNPNFRGILFRRTNDELRELKSTSKMLYPALYKGRSSEARWHERDSQWVFPSGATLWMTYLDKEDDVLRYQGQAFSWIGFDELTQWPTPHAWDYLRSRLRAAKGTGLSLHQRACVDEGEVLTENGWRDISEVREGDLVYSVDPEGSMELKPVTKFHKYSVSEPLARVRKKNLYMSMTPDHRVVFSRQGSSKRELIRFNEHTSKSIDILRSSDSYDGDGYEPNLLGFDRNSYSEFIGWYVAEGSVNQTVLNGNYKVIITQNKEKNHEEVRRVMEASGCPVCYCKNGDFQLNSKELREYLLPLGKSHQKHFPREFLKKADRGQLELAFMAYAKGDGHWQSSRSVSLFTTSDQLADDLQEICMKLGYRTTRTYQVLDKDEHKNRWVVYVSLRKPTTRVDKGDLRNDVEYEHYEGNVYCLSVEDNENFILRQKGSVWVSGNTSNPGGPGHAWVKKTFIDPSPPGKAFWAQDMETKEVLLWPNNSKFAQANDLVGKPMFKRKFIPATLFDNPYLAEDGMYEANLLSLPEHKRKQLLEGDWDVAEGAAFPEFNRQIHTIDPFDIPDNWIRFRACDYGYGSKTAVLWFAIGPNEQLIIYREMFVSGVTAVDLADEILRIEREAGERMRYGVLDSSLWHQRGDTGPSLAEQMISRGCKWRPSDRSKGSRVAGKNELHRRLSVDKFSGEPTLVIFNTCTDLIAQLPILPLDKKNPEDVDTNADDHGYDALRYGIMTRPRFYQTDQMVKRTYQPADPIMGY